MLLCKYCIGYAFTNGYFMVPIFDEAKVRKVIAPANILPATLLIVILNPGVISQDYHY
jgi:hypothetical protein